MDKILKSCDGARQLREKLERKLADLQSEVTSAQEKASQGWLRRYQSPPTSYRRRSMKDSSTLMPVSRSQLRQQIGKDGTSRRKREESTE